MRVILGVIAACAAACAPDFDGTRAPDTHSFGERVMTLMCKRLAYQAEPSDVRGDHLREACDGGALPSGAPPTAAALPASFVGDLQSFLTSDSTLALYDDDTLSRSVASVADLLDEIARDDAAL